MATCCIMCVTWLNYNLKVVILLSSFSLTTALSRFQTVSDYHYNFTLIFRSKAIIKKTCTSMSTTRWWNRDYVVDIEVHVFFLIKAFGRNIELRVNYHMCLTLFPMDCK